MLLIRQVSTVKVLEMQQMENKNMQEGLCGDILLLMMKEMGFSLREIREHMKNYTIDTSLIALRKQLTVLEQQITYLQLIKNRLAHRCEQMENVKEFHEQNQEVMCKEVTEK